MSSFTSKLKLNYIDGTTWELDEAFSYCVGAKGSEWEIKVPKGFKTDFASVPSVIRFLIPRKWLNSKESILHDYLYQSGEKSRVIADAVYFEASHINSKTKFYPFIMYLAVHVFGWIVYNKYRKDEGKD